ncbi:hypothetical protein BU16DRAFT_567777 [Lophium mytilinum]|uniref:Uncharacterized protein n=1 Tax=Lophium mytilinum TaxID=390894 RepID=A0A6A6Q9P6_9PEZI|nr:hypothetical protein BU16DRAFT_567777 [Lophium mytilinum]
MAEKAPQTPAYVSNGEITAKPLSARISGIADSAFVFVMLYLTTLFSTDTYAAALGSPYRRSTSASTLLRPSGVRDNPSPYGRLTGTPRGGGGGSGNMGRVNGDGGSLRLMASTGCGACG